MKHLQAREFSTQLYLKLKHPGFEFQTSHVCLSAEGAIQFAASMGIPQVQQESLITEYARRRWRQNLEPGANPVECQMWELAVFLLPQ